jgi:hypothetical protein
MKYLSFAQSKRQHQYFNLPGEFKSRLPQEMVFPNMTSARADEIYLNDEGLVFDLEEESKVVDNEKFNKFAKYLIFISYWYINKKPYIGVICHKNPKKDWEYYEYAPSLFIKLHYIYFPQDVLRDKYENLINKVKYKETLTEMESLDIAFIARFTSKKDADKVVESLCEIFKNSIIPDKILKLDIKVILSGMILKHITSRNKQEKLMRMIGMRKIENELDELIYEQYGDELDAKDKEIEDRDRIIKSKDNQLKSYQNLIKKLDTFDDLNPEARKIINSLLLLK